MHFSNTISSWTNTKFIKNKESYNFFLNYNEKFSGLIKKKANCGDELNI